MAKTLRVHTLAKELGVASKDVIAKCQAEGIELKNHMSTISVGLAESIREWFSVDADVTSIETAPQVDLEKVRKPKAKPKDESEPQAESDTAGDAPVVTEVAEPVAAEAPAETVEAEAAPVEEPAETPVAETPAADPQQAAAQAPPEVAEEAGQGPVPAPLKGAEPPEGTELPEGAASPDGAEPPGDAEPPAEPEAPAAPPAKDVGPAGPQVVPKPAELQGPRVVRIEAPERVRTPRPRPPSTPDVPAASGGGGGAPGTPARKGRRGKGDDEGDRARSRSPRRQGRGPDPGERLREWRDQDLIERKERLASATGLGLRERRAAERRRQASGGGGRSTAARKGEVEITTPIILKDYCAAIGVPFNQVMKKLMEHSGQMMMINQSIETELAELVAADFGVTVKAAEQKTPYEALQAEFDARTRENLQPRPPIVAMLGHVDHGKTSLLDRIRDTSVASGEAGGITQHIGASRIDTPEGPVTFLDTPGHQAFTSMRARGANLTDVVVLVVAADDGVMPQTAEAIAHAKAAGVQIVVALNKIDLPGVDLNKVFAQLAEHDLAPSEWGGHTDVIQTSATKGTGVDELLTHLSTLSELLELKADPTVPACATVIESGMQEGQGVVCRVLVQEGTLKVGQTVVCGPGFGRIRSLLDYRGNRVKEATPGTPVGVVGLDELPGAGDKLYQVSDNTRAKAIAEEMRQQQREESLRATPKSQSLEALLAGATAEEIPVLNVIVKADAQGSVETLKKQFEEFPRDKVELRILHAAVGAISEADVALAQASSAIVIGFHVVADDGARQIAEQNGVEIRLYRVIYEILQDVHKALEGLLEPLQREEVRGTVEVRQIFNVGRLGTVAGCYVTDGVVHRNHRIRLVRDGRIILENAAIDSLKRFKDDAREVRAGLECGIKLARFDDVKPGDKFEAFEIVEESAKL